MQPVFADQIHRACVTSIVRLKYLIDYVHSKDPTCKHLQPRLSYKRNLTLPKDDHAMAAIWTLLEMSIAIICSCLPAIRSLLSHVFPSVVERTMPDTEHSQHDDSHKIPPLHHFARLEKQGPSYNKWARPVDATTPEPVELDGTSIGLAVTSGDDAHEWTRPDTKEVKIWIHPKFNRNGELMAFVEENQPLSPIREVERESNGLGIVVSGSSTSLVWSSFLCSHSLGISCYESYRCFINYPFTPSHSFWQKYPDFVLKWCLEGPRLSEDVERTLGLGLGSVASGPRSSVRASSGIDIAAGRTLGVGLGLGLGRYGWGGSTNSDPRSSAMESSTSRNSMFRRTMESGAASVGTSWANEMEMVRDIEAGYLHDMDADLEVGSVESGVATRTFLSSPKVKKVC